MNSESNCYFVSSRGILKSSDIHSSKPVSSITSLINYQWKNLTPGSVVYVCTDALRDFLDVLDKISCPIILVTGDSDLDVPVQVFASHDDFLAFIDNPKIMHWFSQNLVLSHPKLSPIPIGIYYHAMPIGDSGWEQPKDSPIEQEKLLISILQSSLPFSKRLIKAHANFHFLMTTKYGADRVRAKQLIAPDLVDYESQRVDRETTWRNQSKYAFVISPHGNGLDCHRTWEALCLGCIPIVRTSPLDTLYEGLPVYIVQDWSDVTEENLRKVLVDFSNRKFDLNRLTLKYWMDKINSKKIS